MSKSQQSSPTIKAYYEPSSDTLTFTFTLVPQPAVAEEMADEVWVRFDPITKQMITIDVLNFSMRLQANWGTELIYQERTDMNRLETLLGFGQITPSLHNREITTN